MRGRYWRGFGLVLLAVIGSVFALSGCGDKEEKKKEPAKKEAKKAPEKKEPEKKEPEKKEPEKKEPEKKEPEKKEPEKKEPPLLSATDKLVAAREAYPALTFGEGEVEKHLAALKALADEFPDTDAGFYAGADLAATRLDCLVLTATEKHAGLLERMMAFDGKLEPGKEADAAAAATYYQELAQAHRELAKKASKSFEAEEAEAYALLLDYMAQESLEKAGKLEASQLVLPAAWIPGEEGAAVAKTEEKAAAGDDTATAGVVEERTPPYYVKGEVDRNKLFVLATGNSAVSIQARYLALARLNEAMGAADGESTQYFAWWKRVALGAGGLLCELCPHLERVPIDHLEDVLFLKENEGLVCPGAIEAIALGKPATEAVATTCLTELGIAEADAGLVTPSNALALRFYALTTQLLSGPVDEKSRLAAEFAHMKEAVEKHLLKQISLFPVIESIPPEKWEEMKEKLVLRTDMESVSPTWDFMPLEMMVVDEKGVSQALRPVVETGGKVVEFLDSKEGLRFPGKLVVDVPGINKEIEEKHAKLKAAEAPYDEKLGAFLEKVTIRGTEFKKPDFSIPSVVEAAKQLSATAGGFEPAVFPYLLDKKSPNHQRPEWAEFKDTVGKAALYAVDQATPALLFKRIVDSLYYADYKDDRLVKGTGAFDTVPTVYFTEKFVDETVLDTTYKRPILVYVTGGGQVRFYPPTNKTRKGKMTPKRHPRRKDTAFPSKYRQTVDPREVDPLWNLFVAITKASSTNFEEQVVGIATDMAKKWDNGNVFYVVAADEARSGTVVKVADLLARLPERDPIIDFEKALPGYACDMDRAPHLCPTSIVVLFPDVEIPHLPGKKKVQEVEAKVYCDQKDIASKIKAKRGAIKFCYDPELQKNSNLKGKVVFNFTIGAAGRITEMSVASDGLGNKNVVSCTMGVIKKINFRRPIGGECVVRYPYVFSP